MIFFLDLKNPNFQDMVNFRKYFCLLLLLCPVNVFPQLEIDSLNSKNFNQLFDVFQQSSNDEFKEKVARIMVQKAKENKNDEELVVGYTLNSEVNKDFKKLAYCDSVILMTSQKSRKLYPSMALYTKGVLYQEIGDYEKAIDNYLIAKKYATIHNNENLILIINFYIGTLKRKVGDFENALNLYKSNITLAKKHLQDYGKSFYYLNTLISISNIYYELQELDSASYYNILGVIESKKFNNEETYHHFSINAGIVHFLAGEYDDALDSLNKHNTYFESINDNKTLTYSYHYLGEVYHAKGDQLKSIKFHQKVDSVYKVEPDIIPITRNSYLSLINYYKNKNDLKNQLFYINRLVAFDSLAYSKEFYLNKTLLTKYDIPKLKKEKQSIMMELKKKEGRFFRLIIYTSIILMVIVVFSLVQYRKKRIYKKRFLEIINEPKIKSSGKNKLPEEVVKKVLKSLETFENKNIFLSKKINLSSLAEKLNTNSSYLSKIINQYKNDSFSHYLNKLRINYIIEELKNNSKYRKYTVKAISEISGFNNAESFSKAFHKITGLKPSYFIKELEKNNRNS